MAFSGGKSVKNKQPHPPVPELQLLQYNHGLRNRPVASLSHKLWCWGCGRIYPYDCLDEV